MTKIDIDNRIDIPEQTYGGIRNKQGNIKFSRLEVIATADDKINLAEPSSPTQSVYPYNSVLQTQSGHLREMDDTPSAERIFEMHKSGTFYEIHPDGTRVSKIFGADWEISIEDKMIVVGGNMNITVQGNANILVSGDVKTKVGGNYEMTVMGDFTQKVLGKSLFHSQGDMNIQTKSSLGIRSEANSSILAHGDMNITTDSNLNVFSSGTSKLQASSKYYINASTIDLNLSGISATRVQLNDMGAGVGLNISDSVAEPRINMQLITRTDNLELSPLLTSDTNITFPKDRKKIS